MHKQAVSWVGGPLDVYAVADVVLGLALRTDQVDAQVMHKVVWHSVMSKKKAPPGAMLPRAMR